MKTTFTFSLALLISSMLFATGWDFPTKDKKRVTLEEIPNWGKEGFAVEVWCRPEEADCGYAVLMRGAFGLPKITGDNAYVAYLKRADGTEASPLFKLPLELGRFHHYVLTGTPEQICHYRDGKLLQTKKGSGIPNYIQATPLYIGHSIGWHHKDIQISVSVAGEGYQLAVGTPDGRTFIAVLCGQLNSCSAVGRNLIDISFVAKEHL